MNPTRIVDSLTWSAAAPDLSVLIPFYKDDPRALLAALISESDSLHGRVEIVLLEDGADDTEMSERIAHMISTQAIPVRYIQIIDNEGRAKGRNRLVSNARGRYLLFLDSDMLPDTTDFLQSYISLIPDNPEIVIGGFSVKQCPPRPEHALHLAMAARSDCLPAQLRAAQPEKYVFTSNLFVRRDIFEAEAFDETFKGWGWEDVEWGARVGKRFQVRHIDNTATHLGLDRPEVLAGKYEQSVGNFARLMALHPHLVATFPSFRLARLLKHSPLRGALRTCLKHIALSSGAPLIMRVFAMKTYRAALYAEVV